MMPLGITEIFALALSLVAAITISLIRYVKTQKSSWLIIGIALMVVLCALITTGMIMGLNHIYKH
jgi:membrane protein YdbS with pleckstrin-like domain